MSQPPTPDRAAFLKRHAPSLRGQGAMKALHSVLIAAPTAPGQEEATAWLSRLLEWVLRGGKVAPAHAEKAGEVDRGSSAARLAVLTQVLSEETASRQALAEAFAVVLEVRSVTRLLCRTGLPGEHAFFSELTDRLVRKVLPAAPETRGLSELLTGALRRPKQRQAFESLPEGAVAALLSQVTQGKPDLWRGAREALADAAALLCAQAAAIGTSEAVRARSPDISPRRSPFILLPDAFARLVRAAEAADGTEQTAATDACLNTLAGCRRVVTTVLAHLERSGVSVNLVYRLELATLLLQRLQAFVDLLAPWDAATRSRSGVLLVAALAEDVRHDSSVSALVQTNLRLLARKIIERTGESGEHYITRTGGEQLRMLGSAAGGGILTAGTCALKFIIAAAQYPLFVAGALASFNYAGSFLLMQALGFTLATKQPSMTAAALAAAMGKDDHRTLDDAVRLIARIVRSQLTAAVGNLGAVIPAAFALDVACRALTGEPFLNPANVEKTVHSLHPTQSGLVFYAAFTGVLLWMSSVVAGWVENWAVYRRVPEALAASRMARLLLGRRGAVWLGKKLAHGISGIGGNTSLGAFLGFTPMMGTFLGLPLDVRHVTLSTGALVLAVCAEPALLGSPALNAAVVGILITGALNFGVSFALALSVALKARDVPMSERLRLVTRLLRRFVTAPHTFFVAWGDRPPPEVLLPAPEGMKAPPS